MKLQDCISRKSVLFKVDHTQFSGSQKFIQDNYMISYKFQDSYKGKTNKFLKKITDFSCRSP